MPVMIDFEKKIAYFPKKVKNYIWVMQKSLVTKGNTLKTEK